MSKRDPFKERKQGYLHAEAIVDFFDDHFALALSTARSMRDQIEALKDKELAAKTPRAIMRWKGKRLRLSEEFFGFLEAYKNLTGTDLSKFVEGEK